MPQVEVARKPPKKQTFPQTHTHTQYHTITEPLTLSSIQPHIITSLQIEENPQHFKIQTTENQSQFLIQSTHQRDPPHHKNHRDLTKKQQPFTAPRSMMTSDDSPVTQRSQLDTP